MSALILPRGARQPSMEMMTAENEHQFQRTHPIHPTYKVLLQAMIQLCPELKGLKMYFDHTPGKDKADHEKKTHQDVGVFQAKFDHWTIVLNWTEETRQHLPPDYFGVDFGDSSAGILGLWADIRTCWKCGLTGYRDDPKKVKNPRPCVVPSKPCPNCRQLDWWARLVTQDNLVAAASAAVQDKIPAKPYLWDALGGRDVELRAQGLKAGAYQLEGA